MQVSRLLEIIIMLLNKNKITAKELADKFGVSIRTIYRDIDILCTSNIPVFTIKGNNGGISMMEEYTINKYILTDEEKEKMLLALSGMNATQFTNSTELIAKLNATFNMKNNMDWLYIDFSSFGSGIPEKDKFETIKMAITQNKVLSFNYFNSLGEESFRSVEPLKLIFKSHCWYLAAFCKKKDDYRLFKLSRMKNLKLSQEMFNNSLPEDFIFDCNVSKLVNLKLKFNSSLAYRVYDDFDNNSVRVNDDGTYEVNTELPDGEWLYNYILSFGCNVEVIEPVQLRKKIIDILEKTLKIYNEYDR